VKVYVAAVEVLRTNKRQDETQLPTKIDGFLNFTPLSFNANVLLQGSFESRPKYDKTQGSGAVFSFLYG
jgi:hypothetical protein